MMSLMVFTISAVSACPGRQKGVTGARERRLKLATAAAFVP